MVTCEVDADIFLAQNSFGISGTPELNSTFFRMPEETFVFFKVDLIFGNVKNNSEPSLVNQASNQVG